MFKVGLMISSDITVSERKKYLKMLIHYLKKLNDICPQQVYDNILNNTPKIFSLVQEFPKYMLRNMLYTVAGLKLLCSATILALVVVVEGYVFFIMTTCYLNVIVIL